MRMWRARDPVTRFQSWMIQQGWWEEGKEAELRQSIRKEVIKALEQASGVEKNAVDEMFDDVYDVLPPHLQRQQEEVLEYVRRHPEVVPAGMPITS